VKNGVGFLDDNGSLYLLLRPKSDTLVWEQTKNQ